VDLQAIGWSNMTVSLTNGNLKVHGKLLIQVILVIEWKLTDEVSSYYLKAYIFIIGAYAPLLKMYFVTKMKFGLLLDLEETRWLLES
jgi:hypothetical protein